METIRKTGRLLAAIILLVAFGCESQFLENDEELGLAEQQLATRERSATAEERMATMEMLEDRSKKLAQQKREFPSKVRSEEEGRALVRDKKYRQMKELWNENLLEVHQKLAGHLKLKGEQKDKFIAVLSDVQQARLEMSDQIRKTRGMALEDRIQILENWMKSGSVSATKLHPQHVNERLRSILGEELFNKYLESMSDTEVWR